MAFSRREQLIWDLLANDEASDAFRKVSESMHDTDEEGSKLLETIGRFVTFGMVSHQVWGMTQAASDLGEAINLNERIFKENSASIQQWAEGGADAFGLSKTAALDFSAQIGGALQNLGYDMDDATVATQSLIERAADMASAFNKDVTQAIFAVQAGLRGETEPLRQFNVFLDEARIKAEAMSQGLYDGSGALDKYGKAMAIQSLIMQDTAAIAGDFQMTADGLANSQRRLAAHTENLKTSMGEAFLPVAEKAFAIFNSLASSANDLDPIIGQTAITFALVGSAALAAKPQLEKLRDVLSGGVGGKEGLGNAFKNLGKVAATTAVVMGGLEMFSMVADAKRLSDAVDQAAQSLYNMSEADISSAMEQQRAYIETLTERANLVARNADETWHHNASLRDQVAALGEGIRAWISGKNPVDDLAKAQGNLAQMEFEAAREAENQRRATKNLQDGLGVTKPTAEELTGVIGDMQAAFENGASAAEIFEKAIASVVDEVFSAIDSEHAFQAAIDDLTGAIDAAREAGVGWGGVLKGNEAEGRAVAAAASGMMDSIIGLTGETWKQVESTEGAAEAAQAAEDKFRSLYKQAVGQLAEGFGISREKAKELLGTMNDYNVLELIEKYAVVTDEASASLGDATDAAKEWNLYDVTEKWLVTHPEETIDSVEEAMGQLSNWNAYTPREKELKADESDATSGVHSGLKMVETWNGAPAFIKNLLADEGGVTGAVANAIGSIFGWNRQRAEEKELSADDYKAAVGASLAAAAIVMWNNIPVKTKELDVNERDAVISAAGARAQLSMWNSKPTSTKYLRVKTDAYSAYRTASYWMNRLQSRTVYLTVQERYLAARAEGGPVFSGSQYLVGERGPELFVPAQDGWIVSNEDMRAATPNPGVASALGGGQSTVPIVLQLDSRTVWRGLVDLQKRQGAGLGLG